MLRPASLSFIAVAAALALAQIGASAGSGGDANLYANPSFESSLNGWSGYTAGLAPTSDGVVGSNAVRVSAWGTYASIYPYPRPVTSTMAGTAYAAGGWVRSDTPGRTLCLRIREWGGRSAIGGFESCVKVTSGWAQFTPVVYTTIGSGGSLESYVYGRDIRSGDTFEVDGMSLALGTTPASPPPPPVSSTNLYPNGEFDTTVDGWFGYSASLSQKSGAMHVAATAGWPSAYRRRGLSSRPRRAPSTLPAALSAATPLGARSACGSASGGRRRPARRRASSRRRAGRSSRRSATRPSGTGAHSSRTSTSRRPTRAGTASMSTT